MCSCPLRLNKPVASVKFQKLCEFVKLRNIRIVSKWYRQEFFRGTPRQIKGYHALPGGGPRAAAPPRMVTKFKKRIKVLEKESNFPDFQIFFYSEKSIFLRKNFEILKSFSGISEFFLKTFENIPKFLFL